MANVLSEAEAGIDFGTEVTLVRPALEIKREPGTKVWLSLSGDRCAPIKLKFDRAGYNHYDCVYAYCFKLPSGEELWLEFSDELTTLKRIEILRIIMEW